MKKLIAFLSLAGMLSACSASHKSIDNPNDKVDNETMARISEASTCSLFAYPKSIQVNDVLGSIYVVNRDFMLSDVNIITPNVFKLTDTIIADAEVKFKNLNSNLEISNDKSRESVYCSAESTGEVTPGKTAFTTDECSESPAYLEPAEDGGYFLKIHNNGAHVTAYAVNVDDEIGPKNFDFYADSDFNFRFRKSDLNFKNSSLPDYDFEAGHSFSFQPTRKFDDEFGLKYIITVSFLATCDFK